MSNNINRMIVFASILGAILATGLLALNPSTITNAGAQMYDDDRYGYDNHPKKSSDVNVQKIKCINSNINVNGIDITQIPQDGLATTAANEAGAEGVNAQNGNGFGDKINFEKNLVNVCANVNSNDQLKVEPPEEPATATLTVNKEIFGCDNIIFEGTFMQCGELNNDDPGWLPCIGSSISGTIFCQGLPPNLFDIQVLDEQNTQIQQFEGSTAGTTIQNLQPGTYTVNEIKNANFINQLGVNAGAQQECTVNAGFPDGGSLFNLNANIIYSPTCFKYEDEQDNDCSSVTLAAGEHKTCTVKNYIMGGSSQSG